MWTGVGDSQYRFIIAAHALTTLSLVILPRASGCADKGWLILELVAQICLQKSSLHTGDH
jgi:hypothetical protein